MSGSTIWAPIGDKGPDGDQGPPGIQGPVGPVGPPGPGAEAFAQYVLDIANTADSTKGTALVGKAARVADSIAELRTLSKNGSKRVFVFGYYAVGDGGGGPYYYDPADTTSLDNGGVVIVAADGGRWKLVNYGETNLYQWGCIGNGVFVNNTQVQNAVDWAAAGAYVVKVPSCIGFRLTATIASNGNPRLVGEHIQISKDIGQNLNAQGLGSWFFLDHTGIGFNFNNGGTVVKRVWIELIGTYRTQPVPGAGVYTPTNHNYDFVFYNCDSIVRDIVFWNSSKGILIDATPSTSQSRGDISGIYGCPLMIGITINFIADVLRLDNIHFWPYLSSNTRVADYIRDNSIGIQSYRCDNAICTRYFTYAYKYSLYIGTNSYGTSGKFKLSNADFDAWGVTAIFIDGQGASFNIEQCVGQGQSSSLSSNFLEFATTSNGCNGSIDNSDIGYCSGNIVRVGGGVNNVLRIGSNMRMYQWNGSGAGFPAIGCTTGNYVELSTMPYFTAPFNNGPNLDTAGNIKGRVELDAVVYTTDAAGKCSIVTGMGREATNIYPSVINSSTPLVAQQTGTANQLLVSNVGNGTPLASQLVTMSALIVFK